MATYGTDLSVFDAADAATNWAELSGHTSGAAPSADTENYLQNSISVSQATGQATGTNAGMECDYGSTITWTAGWVIMAWQYYTAPTNIQTWASGGMRIGVGSSSGNMNYWNAMGDNFAGSPYACWQNTAIDPSDPTGATFSNLAVDGTADGSPTAGSVRVFGSLPNVRAKISKGSPHACDIIRYGRGEIYATGTGATFSGYATANDGSTARWGLFQAVQGGYKWKGLFSFGQSATSVTFSDSNKTIFVDDTPRVRPTFNKIEVNNASSSVTLTGITIQGVGTSITGSAPVSPGDFEMIDSATLSMTGCNYIDLGTFIFDASTNSNTITGCVFRRCQKVTQGGATITGGTFDSCSDTIALAVDTLGSVTGNHFVSSGTGHAVDLGTISTDTTLTWNNTESGYAIQTGTAANRTILVNVTTGNTLTINVSPGASSPTYYNTGSGTVNVQSSISIDIHVEDQAGADIASAYVYVDEDDASPFIMNTTTDVNGDASGSYSGAASTAIIRIRKYGYKPYRGTAGLTSNINLNVTLVTDPQQT